MISLRVNLLSSARKKQILSQILFRSTENHLLFLFLAFAVLTGTLAASSWLLGKNLDKQKKESATIVQATIKEQGGLPQEKIRALNAQLARISTVQKNQRAWATSIDSVVRLVPAGIHLQKVDITVSDSSVNMSGVAASRATLLEFQSTLSSSTVVKNVSAPVTNLLEKENIPFTLSATITSL